VHRDLKPHNILISRDLHAKIGESNFIEQHARRSSLPRLLCAPRCTLLPSSSLLDARSVILVLSFLQAISA
jgi:serine/threonine protein kinase